jgi:hypothetical protein
MSTFMMMGKTAITNLSKSNMIAFTVMGKSDRQPKPNECDCFLSIQPKIGTLSSHLTQGKLIASPN